MIEWRLNNCLKGRLHFSRNEHCMFRQCSIFCRDAASVKGSAFSLCSLPLSTFLLVWKDISSDLSIYIYIYLCTYTYVYVIFVVCSSEKVGLRGVAKKYI